MKIETLKTFQYIHLKNYKLVFNKGYRYEIKFCMLNREVVTYTASLLTTT